jgi:hypothetical protein
VPPCGIRRFVHRFSPNIHAEGGLPPVEPAAVLLEEATQILAHGVAGNRLEARLAAIAVGGP